MEKEYLLREKPLKALWLFALPMMVGNLFQQFYTMADSMIVGRFVGEDALAAIGASYALTNVFICIAIGGGVGAGVLTGRYFGAREYLRLRLCIRTALMTFLVLSLLLSAFGLLFCSAILRALHTPGNVLPMASAYLMIYFLGLPFLFLYNVLSAMFNALGRSRVPLYLLIFSSALNIGLDLCLVCGLERGIEGAGLGDAGCPGNISGSFFPSVSSNAESMYRSRHSSPLRHPVQPHRTRRHHPHHPSFYLPAGYCLHRRHAGPGCHQSIRIPGACRLRGSFPVGEFLHRSHVGSGAGHVRLYFPEPGSPPEKLLSAQSRFPRLMIPPKKISAPLRQTLRLLSTI